MNTGKCKRPKRIRPVPLVSSRCTETCLLDVLQLFPLQRRWSIAPMDRFIGDFTIVRLKKNVPTPIGSRYCTMPPESGLDKCVLPFIFCPNVRRTTRFEMYMVTFVLISRNVSCISYENFIDNTDWLTENFLRNRSTFVLHNPTKRNLFRLTVATNKLRIFTNSWVIRFILTTNKYIDPCCTLNGRNLKSH